LGVKNERAHLLGVLQMLTDIRGCESELSHIIGEGVDAVVASLRERPDSIDEEEEKEIREKANIKPFAKVVCIEISHHDDVLRDMFHAGLDAMEYEILWKDN
jgi:hypothetical protein